MFQEEKRIVIETLRSIDASGTMRTVCVKGFLTVLLRSESHTSCVFDKGDKSPDSWIPPCQTCYIMYRYKDIHHLSYAAWKGWLVTHKEIASPVQSG